MTVSPNLSTLGMLYCVLSAVAYTAYNVCLRDVADECDPAWINCVQASVGTAVFGVYLAYQTVCGRRALPPWKELLALLAIGLITQLGGVLLVYAMGIVGVGVSATLQMGLMLAASAALGLMVLGERVSWRQVAAILLIIGSVVFFSKGAQSASEAMPTSGLSIAASDGMTTSAPANAPNPDAVIRVLLGVAAAVLSGLAFAVLTVGVRKTVTGETSPEAIVFLINAMGVVALGPWCVYRLGPETLVQTPPGRLGVMLVAGALNLVAFLLVTKSLQLITVVRVNVVNNALTMALTVAAGIALFAEPLNRDLMLGILSSVAGVLLISLAAPQQVPK